MKKLTILFSFAVLSFLATNAWGQCTNGTLYAVNGAGGAASNLYSVDVATGAATLIGPTGFSHVTDIDVSPVSGVMYGVVSDLFGSGNTQLITIDPNTGAGTLVGTTGHQIPDISFNSAGALYGWSECSAAGPCNTDDNLVTIDLTTGVATIVGVCGCSTSQTGLAFDPADNLYMKSGGQLHLMDAATGTIISTTILSASPQNLLAFDNAGTPYTGTRSFGNFTLQTIDIATGTVTGVGTNAVGSMAGLGFCGAGAPAAVPTMGEWGLIILALLVLSFGTVFVMRRQTALAPAGNASMSQGSGIPFDRASFGKMLAGVILGLLVVFGAAVLCCGYEMTSADVPGSLIAAPIAAYLLHLLFGKMK